MKTIEVVAAVIIRHNQVFATQRGYGDFRGRWEFPGGKIEPGETPQQALIREIQEELHVSISVGRLLRTVEYDYPQFHLTMHCFLCSIESGTLELAEHEAAVWVTAQNIHSLDWLPADVVVLDAVKACLG